MAASVAHQIGTPLNLISGYVQVIREEEGASSRVTRRLEIVQEQIAKVTSIVRTMLDHARRPTPKETTDIVLLVQRVCDVARPKLEAASVRLELSIAPVPPVMADGVQLELALLNLVTNSLDAMPRGGVMAITVSRTAEGGVLIQVGDTGVGIPADLLPRVFEPWVTTKDAGRGTGLGLSITRDVVEGHGGTIAARSEVGVGSVFTVQLPGAPQPAPTEETTSSTRRPRRLRRLPTMSRILIVDDDRETCRFITELLEGEDREIESAYDPSTALRLVHAHPFDLVISDINLNADKSGLDILRAFRDANAVGQVLLISGFGTLETAIDAVRAGAFDYISKPFNITEVKATVERALAQAGPRGEEGPSPPARDTRPPGLLGRTAPMLAVYKQIAHAADASVPVLIVGESGTGKELVARAIHAHGRRRVRPFVPVNCGAIAESLLESELFGHTRGSFTGAVSDTKGLFEQANGGTVFLDEIGETSPALQVKLLRVLEEGEFRAVGAARATRVDVRVVAATNVELEKEVSEQHFRQDLFYRLSVIVIRVPPLRERSADIPLLVAQFLQNACARAGRVVTFTPAAVDALSSYGWPGNVRELENTVERLVLFSRGSEVDVSDLPQAFHGAATGIADRLFAGLPSLDEVERRYLVHVLDAVGGNRTRAAEVMGIDRRTLYRMAERFGIDLKE